MRNRRLWGSLLAGLVLVGGLRSAESRQRERRAEPRRTPLAFRAPVLEKNFALLSLLEQVPEARALVREDGALSALATARRAGLAKAASACEADSACMLDALRWKEDEIDAAGRALAALYRSREPMRRLVEGAMRESGMFVRYHDKAGDEMLGQAWRDAAAGMNRLLDVYGAGKPPRYAAIDGPMFDVKSENYRRLLHVTAGVLQDRREELTLFFQPTLRFALALLDLNRRDEAGRLEPLHLGESQAALRRIASIRWKDYPYSVILVPGSGADRPSLNLSPWGKMRLTLAVKRFRENKAPLLLVSGGYVHPSQTPFCEALEMKKSLVAEFGVPSDAILIEPHARHTTTNLRNAARLLYRYGIPFDKTALLTTDDFHSRSIEGPEFATRCERELGYQPHRILKRLSPFDLEFLPRIEALQADATDPLDP